MADILCPRCGEPWDMDTLHEAAAEQATSYDDIARRFRRDGCIAFGWQSEPCQRGDMSPLLSAIAELAGSDMDGYAADVQDAEWMGLL